jgi:hypothetical protein
MKRSNFNWDRKVIRTYIDGLYTYDFEGEITEVIQRLNNIYKENTDKGFVRIFIVSDYGYDNSVNYTLHGERDETDQEYDTRIQQQEALIEQSKALKKAKKNEDYQLYLRLKKQFEKE